MNPDDLSPTIATSEWEVLRAHTNARIALGRTGYSLPTRALLQFGLAHAQARDAVHHPLDINTLKTQLQAAEFSAHCVSSCAPDRHSYLLRPDLGRVLQDSDRELLQAQTPAEFVIVIADGLSSIAVEHHALPLLKVLRESFNATWESIPIVIANQGRVAIGDDIGAALRARLVIVFIGERPGLSSPDSLGIYLTFAPQQGKMDSERNCISNVRPQGLSYAAATHKLIYLIREALRLKLSGVGLKDDSDLKLIAAPDQTITSLK